MKTFTARYHILNTGAAKLIEIQVFVSFGVLVMKWVQFFAHFQMLRGRSWYQIITKDNSLMIQII